MGGSGGTKSREESVAHNADLTLASRVAAAERRAFDALFERYADRIYALACRRAADPDSGRDLTERMLERVFSDLADYGGEVSLDHWVLGRCKRVLAGRRADSEPRSPMSESPMLRDEEVERCAARTS
jgi:DNA-directed RNA polymerase specialized sigma24 family protein